MKKNSSETSNLKNTYQYLMNLITLDHSRSLQNSNTNEYIIIYIYIYIYNDVHNVSTRILSCTKILNNSVFNLLSPTFKLLSNTDCYKIQAKTKVFNRALSQIMSGIGIHPTTTVSHLQA